MVVSGAHKWLVGTALGLQFMQASVADETDFQIQIDADMLNNAPESHVEQTHYTVAECNGLYEYSRNCEEDGRYWQLRGNIGYFTFDVATSSSDHSPFTTRDHDPDTFLIGISDQEHYSLEAGLFDQDHALVRWIDEKDGIDRRHIVSFDDALRMKSVNDQLGIRFDLRHSFNANWSVRVGGSVSRSKYSFTGGDPVFQDNRDMQRLMDWHSIDAAPYRAEFERARAHVQNLDMEHVQDLDISHVQNVVATHDTGALQEPFGYEASAQFLKAWQSDKDFVISLSWLASHGSPLNDWPEDLDYKKYADQINDHYQNYVVQYLDNAIENAGVALDNPDLQPVWEAMQQEAAGQAPPEEISAYVSAPQYQALTNYVFENLDNTVIEGAIQQAYEEGIDSIQNGVPETLITAQELSNFVKEAYYKALQDLNEEVQNNPNHYYKTLKPLLRDDLRHYLQRYQTDSDKWSHSVELETTYTNYESLEWRLGAYYQLLRSGFDDPDISLVDEKRYGLYSIAQWQFDAIGCHNLFSINYYDNHYAYKDGTSGNISLYGGCRYQPDQNWAVDLGAGVSVDLLDGVRTTLQAGVSRCWSIEDDLSLCGHAAAERFRLSDPLARQHLRELEDVEGTNIRFSLEIKREF